MTSHVALDSQVHRDLRIRGGASAEIGDGVMACMTVPSEFRRVQNEFPILFRRDLDSGRFSALALFGFENGENLFVENGRWDARYRPLALSIQPFLIGRAQADGPTQVHVDLAHKRIAGAKDEGLRTFDDHGQPTPYLEAVMAGLDELDQGYRSSEDFFAALERYELLEPFSFDVELRDGSSHRLVGYHLIDEDKLRTLEPGALAELHSDGHLMPTFMALASLSNLAALVERKNKSLGDG
jgi:SapC protein